MKQNYLHLLYKTNESFVDTLKSKIVFPVDVYVHFSGVLVVRFFISEGVGHRGAKLIASCEVTHLGTVTSHCDCTCSLAQACVEGLHLAIHSSPPNSL